MEFKLCIACRQLFKPRPQAPNQAYCSKPECQRDRKRRWQQDKLKTDADYRDNQLRAQLAWLDRNPDYWRNYRDAHPEYVKCNRDRQRARNTRHVNPVVAKMDVLPLTQSIPLGNYRLRPITIPGIAKMDAWIVEITRLPDIYQSIETNCKETT